MILEDRWLRETYVDLLIESARKDKRIVIVEADLMKAAGTNRFAEEFKERTVDVGVAESNMIGVAAGMSAMGKIPFTHTFTAFATRRVCDQVTLSVAYAGLNVKMMGSDPGITAEYNGGTHMSMEDVSIMRNVPGMIIYEPVDSVQLTNIFPQILAHEGPLYIRLLRRNAAQVYEEGTKFTLGKGCVVAKGCDVTIFASGIMVAEAMMARDELLVEGVSAEVIDIHTIKPLDEELVIKSASKTKAVVVAENHSIIGGLGSAISETLGEHKPTLIQRVGVKDHFGEVGLTPFLKEKYGLTKKEIIAAAKCVIKRKETA
jgi:Transketolase, C-terminal subunit